MKKTAGGIKKFSDAEKLLVLKEAKEHGVKVTLSKYDVYPATYYYWKKKFSVYGEEGLSHGNLKSQSQRIKQLEKENAALKELVAEKELASKLKDELLKKKHPSLYQALKKKS